MVQSYWNSWQKLWLIIFPRNRFWGNSFRVTIALLEKYSLLNENYDVSLKFSDNDCRLRDAMLYLIYINAVMIGV